MSQNFKMIRKLIFHRLRRHGINFSPTYIAPSLLGFLKKIQHENIEINSIYDVGAYKGNWTRTASEILGKDKTFFLFEPNTEHNLLLAKTGYPYFNVLLSDREKTIDFYSSAGQGDSYFPENNPIHLDGPKRKMQSKTLDQVVAGAEIEMAPPDLLKIDTQGSEIDILNGATATIKDTKLIILECPIVKYNLGAPDIQQYIYYMASIDFIPWSVVEIHFMLNVFVQLDIAFMSKKFFESHYGSIDKLGYLKT